MYQNPGIISNACSATGKQKTSYWDQLAAIFCLPSEKVGKSV